MAIEIICLGKTKQKFIEKFTTLSDIKLTKTNTIEIVKEKEADILEKHLNGFVIALDEHGAQKTSVEFANLLEKHNYNIKIIIGGVYGLSKRITNKASMTLGFSKLTFTHRMIRLILMEQLYRASTIISGKKYHY